MPVFNNSKKRVSLTFEAETFKELMPDMQDCIGTGQPYSLPNSSTNSKVVLDHMQKSINILSQDAKTTSFNEQLLNNKFGKIDDEVDKLKTELDNLKNLVSSLTGITKEQDQKFVDIESSLTSRISTLESLHFGMKKLIPAITKPIIDRAKMLYNFDMRLDTNGTHIVRTVIPYKTTYYVEYEKDGKELNMFSTENADLKFFNEDGFLAFSPKAFPNTMTTIKIYSSQPAPLPVAARR